MASTWIIAVIITMMIVGTQSQQVIRVRVEDEMVRRKVQDLDMDVWSHSSTWVLGENDVMVDAIQKEQLESLGMDTSFVLIDDVAALIQRESEEIKLNSIAPAAWFDAYHNFDDIRTFSAGLVTNYSKLATFVPSAGKSIQGRDIHAVRITGGTGTKKGQILLVGGQHAREWIGPATVLYIANKLLTGYGNNANITALVNNFDFTIVPMANPDGYVFSWSSNANRLWRKNRRQNTGGSYGVDLNRNWGDHWCQNGGSTNPTSDTYCGTGPFSEPETQALRNITQTYGPFAGAIDFHSYGQLIMRPYGWSNQAPPNNAQLKAVGDGMRDAIRAYSGKAYTSQAIWELYLSAGSSCDWWLTEAKIPLAYGFEVRDTGTYGFQLPATEITPTGEENYAAVAYLASRITA